MNAARIAAVVLAAGQSRRMGSSNKLLCEIDGKPLVRSVVEAAVGSASNEVIVVTGHEASAVRHAISDLPVNTLFNPDYPSGMASSLVCAIAAIPPGIDAVVILLGDMPLVSSALINQLIGAFDPATGKEIVVPMVNGQRGNPVLFGRRHFPELLLLQGDKGARQLLEIYSANITTIEGKDNAALLDIDTPEALGQLTISAIRNLFPALKSADESARHNESVRYVDNAAMTQLPQPVLDAVRQFEAGGRANVQRGVYRWATAATEAFENARGEVANFLHAPTDSSVVFTSGTTASINLLALGLADSLQAGDEILLSLAEHHSNLIPWQILQKRCGVVLKYIPLDEEGRFNLDSLAQLLSPRTRLVAITQVSNVTGAISDVAKVVDAAKTVGARVFLDGAQAVAHGPVDVAALGIDFYAFSGHKCFAPTGIGLLWGKSDALALLTPPFGGGGMVASVSTHGFRAAEGVRALEAGTPPIAEAIGLGAALHWMNSLPWQRIAAEEKRLGEKLLQGLLQIPGLRLLGPATMEQRLPIFSFTIEGIHPHDLCHLLDSYGVALRGGHHCAEPLLQALGAESASRASLALYNSEDDVNALLAGILRALEILR
jgi:cysteine desulfurase/selenocysteine lyase